MCPPGVDQTTRTRQQWHILSPLAKGRYNITEDCMNRFSDSSLANFLNGEYTWDAFDKLAVRSTADLENTGALLSKLSRTSNTHRASPIEELPNELLAIIFNDAALGVADIVALGLCSKTLWQHCLSRAGVAVAKGPWANLPLICTGTYLTDVPATIHEVVPSLKAEEDSWRARQPLPGQGARNGPGICPARRWNWSKIAGFDSFLDNTIDYWLAAFDVVAYNRKNGITTADKKVLRQSLGQMLSMRRKPGGKWTLRNHTTHEYLQLRCAPTSGSEQQLHVKGAPSLCLDKALLMRICWTSVDPYRGYRPALEKILRGQWAGHRFDIVRESHCSTDGWSDVTEEMVREWKEWKCQPEPDR